MDAGDMQAIQELVRVFSENYARVPLGDMPLSAILPSDPIDYLQSVRESNKPLIIKIFFDDLAFHKVELRDIRRISCLIEDQSSKNLAEVHIRANYEGQAAAEKLYSGVQKEGLAISRPVSMKILPVI